MVYVDDSVRIGVPATTNNKFVAVVSSGGYLLGNHVGETTINYKGSSAKVTVRGHYHTLDGVITEWGLTPEEVRAQQATGKLEKEGNLDGGQYTMLFSNVGAARAVIYGFSNNKLYISIVLSRLSDSYDITDYLAERYYVLPEKQQDGSYFGLDAYDPDLAKTVLTISFQMDNKVDYRFMVSFISKAYYNESSSSAKRNIMKLLPKE